MEFPKQYNPKDFELALYEEWERTGKFKPTEQSRTGDTFYIPIPPPNVTGNLHIGHALTLTLEDIMVRYHRMKGDSTLWVPGTDHAGIATQAKVEQKLAKEGKTRDDLGREAFLDEVWKWKDEYANNINNQVRKMGASCDWSRERFTLDDGLSANVQHAFMDLYNKGLLYRGEYMVNYSPTLGSVISDIEVDYKEEEGKLYYITYFVSGSDNELVVATTRPETLLGDQAIAVHPKDKRFKKLIGRSVILPIVNKEIPIIGDEMVDIEFGTGAVKITPAHDATDFEVAGRHNLRRDYIVIDKNGYMTEEAGIFAGQDAETARENIVELLKAKGNLVKIEPYTHKVGYCSRGGCKVETVVSTQWFVKSSELAKKVIAGYKKKEFEIIPSRFNKSFEDWIYNLRDWCVSRQLWWGHQIPAYYDVKTNELLTVSLDEDAVFAKYGKENVYRDSDVLDTWFSSALWPFSILDWTPENPGELFKKFYPANVLETGYDIIFFWVIRMLLFWYEYTGQTPFKTIYLHGLVFDDTGRKMSKSWGNVVDPLDVIDQYSADALRMTCVIGNTPGNNLNFSIKNVEGNSVFLNKLWNVTRFVHANIWSITEEYSELQAHVESKFADLLPHEQWILSRLKAVIDKTTDGMETYNFSECGQDLIAFTRDEFADFFIEEYKLTKDSTPHGRSVLAYAVLTLLKLWHPYIPFASEELYRRITDAQWENSQKGWNSSEDREAKQGVQNQYDARASEIWTGSSTFGGFSGLMESEWPVLNITRNKKIEADTLVLFDVIRSIRNLRATKGVKPGDLTSVSFLAPKKSLAILEENDVVLRGLAKIKDVTIVKSKVEDPQYVYGVVGDIEIFVRIELSAVDTEAEKARLKEQIENKKEYLRTLDAKLLNADFIRNAPEKVVRIEQDKRSQTEDQLKKLLEKFNSL